MLISDQADNISPRHGSQSDVNDSSAELTGSWSGRYLHSSVFSVAAVYATLRQQSARFRCRPPTSSPSTLHVSWARTSPCTEPRFQELLAQCENEPLHGASFPGTCTVLLPSSLLREMSQSSTRVWPVILTSWRSQSEQGETLWGFKDNQASAARPVFTQNKHYENSLVNSTYVGCESSFTPRLSSLLLVTSIRFPLFL